MLLLEGVLEVKGEDAERKEGIAAGGVRGRRGRRPSGPGAGGRRAMSVCRRDSRCMLLQGGECRSRLNMLLTDATNEGSGRVGIGGGGGSRADASSPPTIFSLFAEPARLLEGLEVGLSLCSMAVMLESRLLLSLRRFCNLSERPVKDE